MRGSTVSVKDGKKPCSMCGKSKPLHDFTKDNRLKCGYRSSCKECTKVKERKRHKTNPRISLRQNAHTRAKIQNVPFDITLDDIVIPDRCPVLGIPMQTNEGAMKENSYTLDKIIPEKGYVKGNVQVISMRANRLKNDATVAELEAILDYMKTHTGAL